MKNHYRVFRVHWEYLNNHHTLRSAPFGMYYSTPQKHKAVKVFKRIKWLFQDCITRKTSGAKIYERSRTQLPSSSCYWTRVLSTMTSASDTAANSQTTQWAKYKLYVHNPTVPKGPLLLVDQLWMGRQYSKQWKDSWLKTHTLFLINININAFTCCPLTSNKENSVQRWAAPQCWLRSRDSPPMPRPLWRWEGLSFPGAASGSSPALQTWTAEPHPKGEANRHLSSTETTINIRAVSKGKGQRKLDQLFVLSCLQHPKEPYCNVFKGLDSTNQFSVLLSDLFLWLLFLSLPSLNL